VPARRLTPAKATRSPPPAAACPWSSGTPRPRYLRDGGQVFETYWTTLRGVEAMDNSYALMDLTVYGRQESWEDSPPGWPQACTNTRTMDGAPTWAPVPEWPAGRPAPQWPRLAAGHSDRL
jgi:hypothetical protein